MVVGFVRLFIFGNSSLEDVYNTSLAGLANDQLCKSNAVLDVGLMHSTVTKEFCSVSVGLLKTI